MSNIYGGRKKWQQPLDYKQNKLQKEYNCKKLNTTTIIYKQQVHSYK